MSTNGPGGAPGPQPGAEMPGMMLQVPVPEGVSPGQQVDFDTPDGRGMRAEVPADKKPGDKFEVFVAPQSLMITVPAGVTEGQPVQFVIGEECPPGVKPGDQVSVSIPAPGGAAGPPLTV